MKNLQQLKEEALFLGRAKNTADFKANLRKIGYNPAQTYLLDFRHKNAWFAAIKFLKSKNVKASSFMSGIKGNWKKQKINGKKPGKVAATSTRLEYSR